MVATSADGEELVDAARYGDIEDVKQALQNNVPPDSKDELGRTGLHMACANGHGDVVRLLLAAGAHVNAANEEGNTPLHWACLNGHVEVVRLLMAGGASPSALNSHERTPIDEALNLACRDSVLEIINAHQQQGGSSSDFAVEFDSDGEIREGEFPTKPQ